MEFHCVRVGNLFSKRGAFQMIVPLVILLLPNAITIVVGEFSWLILLGSCLIAVLVAFILLSDYPTAFCFDHNHLIWAERLHVTDSVRDSDLATVTVGDLHTIRFKQTSVERLFNIGRIHFMGDIRSIDSDKKVDRPDMPFYYGGICDFEHFKESLLSSLPKSSFVN